MRTPQPQKTLKFIEVYDITFLAISDPNYRCEYQSDYDLSDDEVEKWIKSLEVNYGVIQFTFTNDEMEQVENTDDLEDLLMNAIQDETGEYFEGYNYRFIYEEDLTASK